MEAVLRFESGKLSALYMRRTGIFDQAVIALCKCGRKERIPLRDWQSEEPPTECRGCKKLNGKGE